MTRRKTNRIKFNNNIFWLFLKTHQFACWYDFRSQCMDTVKMYTWFLGNINNDKLLPNRDCAAADGVCCQLFLDQYCQKRSF